MLQLHGIYDVKCKLNFISLPPLAVNFSAFLPHSYATLVRNAYLPFPATICLLSGVELPLIKSRYLEISLLCVMPFRLLRAQTYSLKELFWRHCPEKQN